MWVVDTILSLALKDDLAIFTGHHWHEYLVMRGLSDVARRLPVVSRSRRKTNGPEASACTEHEVTCSRRPVANGTQAGHLSSDTVPLLSHPAGHRNPSFCAIPASRVWRAVEPHLEAGCGLWVLCLPRQLIPRPAQVPAEQHFPEAVVCGYTASTTP